MTAPTTEVVRNVRRLFVSVSQPSEADLRHTAPPVGRLKQLLTALGQADNEQVATQIAKKVLAAEQWETCADDDGSPLSTRGGSDPRERALQALLQDEAARQWADGDRPAMPFNASEILLNVADKATLLESPEAKLVALEAFTTVHSGDMLPSQQKRWVDSGCVEVLIDSIGWAKTRECSGYGTRIAQAVAKAVYGVLTYSEAARSAFVEAQGVVPLMGLVSALARGACVEDDGRTRKRSGEELPDDAGGFEGQLGETVVAETEAGKHRIRAARLAALAVCSLAQQDPGVRRALVSCAGPEQLLGSCLVFAAAARQNPALLAFAPAAFFSPRNRRRRRDKRLISRQFDGDGPDVLLQCLETAAFLTVAFGHEAPPTFAPEHLAYLINLLEPYHDIAFRRLSLTLLHYITLKTTSELQSQYPSIRHVIRLLHRRTSVAFSSFSEPGSPAAQQSPKRQAAAAPSLRAAGPASPVSPAPAASRVRPSFVSARPSRLPEAAGQRRSRRPGGGTAAAVVSHLVLSNAGCFLSLLDLVATGWVADYYDTSVLLFELLAALVGYEAHGELLMKGNVYIAHVASLAHAIWPMRCARLVKAVTALLDQALTWPHHRDLAFRLGFHTLLLESCSDGVRSPAVRCPRSFEDEGTHGLSLLRERCSVDSGSALRPPFLSGVPGETDAGGDAAVLAGTVRLLRKLAHNSSKNKKALRLSTKFVELAAVLHPAGQAHWDHEGAGGVVELVKFALPDGAVTTTDSFRRKKVDGRGGGGAGAPADDEAPETCFFHSEAAQAALLAALRRLLAADPCGPAPSTPESRGQSPLSKGVPTNASPRSVEAAAPEPRGWFGHGSPFDEPRAPLAPPSPCGSFEKRAPLPVRSPDGGSVGSVTPESQLDTELKCAPLSLDDEAKWHLDTTPGCDMHEHPAGDLGRGPECDVDDGGGTALAFSPSAAPRQTSFFCEPAGFERGEATRAPGGGEARRVSVDGPDALDRPSAAVASSAQLGITIPRRGSFLAEPAGFERCEAEGVPRRVSVDGREGTAAPGGSSEARRVSVDGPDTLNRPSAAAASSAKLEITIPRRASFLAEPAGFERREGTTSPGSSEARRVPLAGPDTLDRPSSSAKLESSPRRASFLVRPTGFECREGTTTPGHDEPRRVSVNGSDILDRPRSSAASSAKLESTLRRAETLRSLIRAESRRRPPPHAQGHWAMRRASTPAPPDAGAPPDPPRLSRRSQSEVKAAKRRSFAHRRSSAELPGAPLSLRARRNSARQPGARLVEVVELDGVDCETVSDGSTDNNGGPGDRVPASAVEAASTAVAVLAKVGTTSSGMEALRRVFFAGGRGGAAVHPSLLREAPGIRRRWRELERAVGTSDPHRDWAGAPGVKRASLLFSAGGQFHAVSGRGAIPRVFVEQLRHLAGRRGSAAAAFNEVDAALALQRAYRKRARVKHFREAEALLSSAASDEAGFRRRIEGGQRKQFAVVAELFGETVRLLSGVLRRQTVAKRKESAFRAAVEREEHVASRILHRYALAVTEAAHRGAIAATSHRHAEDLHTMMHFSAAELSDRLDLTTTEGAERRATSQQQQRTFKTICQFASLRSALFVREEDTRAQFEGARSAWTAKSAKTEKKLLVTALAEHSQRAAIKGQWREIALAAVEASYSGLLGCTVAAESLERDDAAAHAFRTIDMLAHELYRGALNSTEGLLRNRLQTLALALHHEMLSDHRTAVKAENMRRREEKARRKLNARRREAFVGIKAAWIERVLETGARGEVHCEWRDGAQLLYTACVSLGLGKLVQVELLARRKMDRTDTVWRARACDGFQAASLALLEAGSRRVVRGDEAVARRSILSMAAGTRCRLRLQLLFSREVLRRAVLMVSESERRDAAEQAAMRAWETGARALIAQQAAKSHRNLVRTATQPARTQRLQSTVAYIWRAAEHQSFADLLSVSAPHDRPSAVNHWLSHVTAPPHNPVAETPPRCPQRPELSDTVQVELAHQLAAIATRAGATRFSRPPDINTPPPSSYSCGRSIPSKVRMSPSVLSGHVGRHGAHRVRVHTASSDATRKPAACGGGGAGSKFARGVRRSAAAASLIYGGGAPRRPSRGPHRHRQQFELHI
ncbi:hypothetical protein DIPPA_33027 [Diplonema papillatum]|nr:hypothetical protein DIPPA_33027 [Diplonema papillatum]